MDKKINGNTAGIRDALLEQMRELYDQTQPAGTFLTRQLLESLADYTERIRREISVYIARSGAIEDVSIGDSKTVTMPTVRLVRNADRLCGVRCIHTHPNASGYLSDVDLGSLHALKLDAMAAVGVRDGKPTSVYVSYIGEMGEVEREPVIYGPLRYDHLPQKALLDALFEADARLKSASIQVTENLPERAVLVGIEGDDGYDTLEELAELAKTAGAIVVHQELQRRRAIDNATYIGSGKAEELRLLGNAVEAELFIFDDELSAMQLRNLEDLFGVRVIDRTMLILDIFAARATTREGKLQVELAQQKYRLPRLTGMGTEMTRQGSSGVGMRGPGEKKLEIDRRRIKRRIFELEQELAEIEKQRALRRTARQKQQVPVVALVGYTNAGKSTLLNALTKSAVFAEDMLFATLDPVVRQITLPQGKPCLLSDTVGFINKLPHDLVQAFRSTLEEVREASLILHVIDSSSPYYDVQMKVVEEVLCQLQAGDTPRIDVYNKVDKAGANPPENDGSVRISAKTGEGLDALLTAIEHIVLSTQQRLDLVIPYDRYEAMQVLRGIGTILSETHEQDGTHVTALLEEAQIYKLQQALNK